MQLDKEEQKPKVSGKKDRLSRNKCDRDEENRKLLWKDKNG